MSFRAPDYLLQYMDTTYVVHRPEGDVALRVGARHPAFDEAMRQAGYDCWAFITAWNPASRALSRGENDSRQQRLMSELAALGLASEPAVGVPDKPGWGPEESRFVMGVEVEVARELGRQFGQNAVVCGRPGEEVRLVWCEDF